MDLDPADGAWPLDRQDYLGSLLDKASMLRRGYAAGLAAADEPLEPRGLLFAGMGFSGISANFIKDACTRVMDTPFTIVKHYQFPNHVRPDWLTIAVSYSGETEETLCQARAARDRGVPLVSLSTGGTMASLPGTHIQLEAGHQPRAATAFSWAAILGFLQGSGMLPDVPIERMAKAVERVDNEAGPRQPVAANPAKQLATALLQKIPQIYATPSLQGVGLHFRGMINETAKKIADVDLVPECNHNDLMGWTQDPHRDAFAVVCLSHAAQRAEMDARLAFMREAYGSWGIPWHDLRQPAIQSWEDHLEAQAGLLQTVDLTAFYMAMLGDHDPSAIPAIQALKARLRSASG